MKQVTLCINSHPDNVELLTESVRALCHLTTLSSIAMDEVQLALTEAINNVIVHSYKQQVDQLIKLLVSFEDQKLIFTISDTGCGMESYLLETNSVPTIAFDPNDIPALPENGWGLYLMMQNMDKMTYHSEAGTHYLQMIKNFR